MVDNLIRAEAVCNPACVTALARDKIDWKATRTGSHSMSIEDVLAAFHRKRLTDLAREEIAEWLYRRPGLSMEPGPHVVQLGQSVTFSRQP